MVPQNGPPSTSNLQLQQPGLPSFMASGSSFDPSPYLNNLDPTQAAKQMAALTAASQARLANSRPMPLPSSGTNSAPFLGGTNPPNYPAATYDISSGSAVQHATLQMPSNAPASNSPSLDSMSHSAPRTAQQTGVAALKQRQQSFLNGLANLMASRGTPLPPTLTGVPTPSYDPNTSRWKSLEPSSVVGSLRLAGKDVDLLKLWGSVFQSGGEQAVTTNNGWTAVLAQFGLPDEMPQPPPNVGTIPVAQMIAHLYKTMLLPFEHWYRKNMQDQQKRALASRQAGPQAAGDSSAPTRHSSGLQATLMQRQTSGLSTGSNAGTAPSSIDGSSFPLPSTPHIESTPSITQNVPGSLLHDLQNNLTPSDADVLGQDIQGIKRKMEHAESDGKRSRPKIGSEPPSENVASAIATAVDRSSPVTAFSTTSQVSTSMSTPRPRPQPSRRKIEYVPLAREVETYGGRDLKFMETELALLPQRRQMRDINEWGTVDIEALTMSIRSRISTELSYALTTFTLLSTMRGQAPGSGFPVAQSPDLFDELLDLLEEQAFNAADDPETDLLHPENFTSTHRELVNLVHQSEDQPFAILGASSASKGTIRSGPQQRPAAIVMAVLNIIRNLSTIRDNVGYIAKHTRLLDLMLRLCAVTRDEGGTPSPAASNLSLSDLCHVRKDILYTLTNIASEVPLSTSVAKVTSRVAIRSFHLISSYLVDPIEAVSPLSCVQLAGLPLSGSLKPPVLADVALDVFSRMSQADTNRQILSKNVPGKAIVTLFEALVHRLPVVDADFQLIHRDVWLSYLEKIIMAIYSLAFLASPGIKQKIKADRALGFRAVMLRMIQKFLSTQDSRNWFASSTRRAVEAMKVLDDAEDCFDTTKSVAPTMSFGMGYGEVGDNSSEKGTGLLGGHRDIAWEMLMHREVQADDVLFRELESLSRVEC